MRTIVIGNTTPNTFMRPFVGTRAQITAANLPNGTLAIVTDEAENSIDLTVVYPVGSIYMNATSDTNPATLFGIGTWSLIDSKFLYGANSLLSDLGDTGGATTATLVQNNLPTSLTGLTISAMTGSTSTESTDHTHTVTIADAGEDTTLTGNTNQIDPNQWNVTGSLIFPPLNENVLKITGDGLFSVVDYDMGTTARWYDASYSKQKVNLNTQHTHAFSIPLDWTHTHTNTVSNQSEHSTHSHTVGVDSQTINLTNFGSGTSFSILPTYRKVAMWYRTL